MVDFWFQNKTPDIIFVLATSNLSVLMQKIICVTLESNIYC